MFLVYVYRVALDRFCFCTCMFGTVVIESQVGEETQNMLITNYLIHILQLQSNLTVYYGRMH